MSRSEDLLMGKGLSVCFPYNVEKKNPGNVVLFDLENFYTGLVGTAPNNDSMTVRWE